MGSVEQPACAATVSIKPKHGNRIRIKHLPVQACQADIDHIISAFGPVLSVEIVKLNKESHASITYESPDQAQKAYEQLQNYTYQGSCLKVDYLINNGRQSRAHSRLSSGSTNGNAHVISQPLRILVPSEFVGAIIGKKGQCIKTITTRCKARVDVHGKELTHAVDKLISIYGQPENCTKACKEILQVMDYEARANVRGEISLRMLANDRYCGRLIGKEGRMIKKIREETGTKIVVTSAQELVGYYPERVVSIRGAVESMSLAEAAISCKLLECLEQDLRSQNMPNGAINGGMPVLQNGCGNYYPYPANGYMNQNFYPLYNPTVSQPTSEHCQIIIPNSAVGAIIGASGSNIKEMMRESGALITIELKNEGNLSPSSERVVNINGTADSCWRANYFVFEKMKSEGFSGNDDVRLKTIIEVPKSTVGRIIGKGGKNVREVQRLTGCIVKLPQQDQMLDDLVHVEVFGNFMATQSAHHRIRAIVNQTLQQNYAPTYYGAFPGVFMPPHVDYRQ